MTQTTFDWTTPAPLWQPASFRQLTFFRPALFEYRTDEFMESFLADVAAPTPAALQGTQLPAPAAVNGSQPKPSSLFQPAHGCFYLTAASLCCREPGFPDHVVARADGETTFFVMRKLVGGAQSGWKEYGWVVKGKEKQWVQVTGSGRSLLEDEERLPVFPQQTAAGRTLYAGYLPVSSGETYNVPAAQLAVTDQGQTQPLDLPIEELGSRFITPLETLPGLPSDIALTTSVYLLLDLWEYFNTNTYLPDVAAALRDDLNATFSAPKAAEKSALMSYLKSVVLSGSLTLAQAIQKAAQNQEALNAPGGADVTALGFTGAYYLAVPALLNTTQTLLDRVRAALPETRPPLAISKLEPSTNVRYVLRFVYERPQCSPPQVIVSQPSQPFVFAPFFDPNAPARPIRIPLPTDVSIAGFRKFKKGVSFVMSDAMRKKMNTLLGKEKTFLDDGQLNPEGGGDFAFICSFSIQIIFIIAFMLLLIFVVIFNLIFWWLPFFKICLPVPKSLIPE